MSTPERRLEVCCRSDGTRAFILSSAGVSVGGFRAVGQNLRTK